MIREHQAEGIRLAKKRGVYKSRRKVVTPVELVEVRRRVAGREPKAKIAREARVSCQTLYRYLEEATP